VLELLMLLRYVLIRRRLGRCRHRLHAARSGNWVDIEVAGDCSDEDLALIERLAQAAATRPVQVRRRRDA
jgi:hypothetical protein